MFVFFFKQKTAYEMRISDWSSDVCSSDLQGRMVGQVNPGPGCQGHRFETVYVPNINAIQPQHRKPRRKTTCNLTAPLSVDFFQSAGTHQCLLAKQSPIIEIPRSEEHMSELQSLISSSYADFCVKKNK